MDLKTLERVFAEAKRRCLEEEAKLHGKPTDYLWRHVERVYHLCIKIGEREKADLDVLKAAALLHDIAKFQVDPAQHGVVGAEMAEKILKNSGFPENKIEAVKHAIKGHARLYEERKTLEAKILLDADIMEKFGAVGVARLFLRCALDGDTIKESIIKHRRMFNIIKDYVETGTAKKMFMERYMFTQNFLERFEKESKAEL
jgi:uncharacterized protein